MKEPSDKTKLRITRRMLKDCQGSWKLALNERDHYRARATKAEQEVAEWKRRFDALLARDEAVAKAV